MKMKIYSEKIKNLKMKLKLINLKIIIYFLEL